MQLKRETGPLYHRSGASIGLKMSIQLIGSHIVKIITALAVKMLSKLYLHKQGLDTLRTFVE